MEKQIGMTAQKLKRFYDYSPMDIRKEFDIFTNKPNLVYLDNASTTQKPNFVVSKTNEYLRNSYANIGRGNYPLSDESDYFFYGCKKKIAKVLNAHENEIFFSYNSTYCINIFAQSLSKSGYFREGSEIILSVEEHHANLLVRQDIASKHKLTLHFLGFDKDYEYDLVQLKQIVNVNTQLICLSACSNVLGIKNNLDEIRSIIGDNCIFAIDASQAIPHYSIDTKSIDCDFLCFSAHKFLAYTGLGVGFIHKRLLQTITSAIVGGGMVEYADLCNYIPKKNIEQFEAGTPNIISIVSLYYALDRRHDIGGYSSRKINENNLCIYLDEQISQVQYLKPIHNNKNTISIRSYICTIDNHKLVALLSNNNICIRSGGHCAQPLHKYLNINQGSIRISPYIYNTTKDIDTLCSILKNT